MKNSDLIIFKDHNNNTLSFSVKGYEYPDCDKVPDKYDKNWLNVWVKVKNNGGEYEAQDPSMLTWELKELLDWFVSISNGRIPKYKTMRFIEPTIYFELLDKNADNEVKIRIHLCCELKPEQLKPNHDDEFVIDVNLSPRDIEDAIAGLKRIIRLYPQR